MARKLKKQKDRFFQLRKYFQEAFLKGFLIFVSLTLVGCTVLGESNTRSDIVYLGWDNAGRPQIFQYSNSGKISQLSEIASGVHDFAVAPGGDQIVFTSSDETADNTVWKLDVGNSAPEKLYDCANSFCSQPVWAPDGRRLLFQKQSILPTGFQDAATLWWLNPENGEVQSLFKDEETLGSAARFSPDGKWLSFFSPIDEGVLVYKFENGEFLDFPNEVGIPVSWSPDSEQIIIPNLNLVIIHGDDGEDHSQHSHEYETATHLFLGNIKSEELTPLSADFNVEDSVPGWSPDGQWIVFGRRPSQTGTGRQLWMMRPDGSEASPLTENFSMNYGPAIWSEDGRYLLYQKFDLDGADEEPGIWLYDLDSSEEIKLVEKGILPQWLE